MRLILFLLFSYFLYGVDATLEIKKDVDQRAKIVIIDASGQNQFNRKSFDIFISDFKISSHFLPSKTYSKESFLDLFNPKFRSSEYVLKYKILSQGSKVDLFIKLFRARDSKKILESAYSINNPKKFPFLIHKAVIDINKKLGFKPINWLNRYIVFSKYIGKKESIIALADYTFTYQKTIIKGGLNIFPVWGDKKQNSIIYTSFNKKIPTLYRLNLKNGKITKIISSEGMLTCSDISRSGRKLLLTMAPNSQPDIYIYNLDSKKLKRVTKFSGIDVGGKFADSEKSIVFVSNRLGFANIFKKSLLDGSVDALVFHGKNNDACDAFENKVVYSSKEGAKSFNIYLTTTSAATPRPLTSSGINQFPKFSPDGNTLMYIKRTSKGNFVGYINFTTNSSLLFPISLNRIQSIDW